MCGWQSRMWFLIKTNKIFNLPVLFRLLEITQISGTFLIWIKYKFVITIFVSIFELFYWIIKDFFVFYLDRFVEFIWRIIVIIKLKFIIKIILIHHLYKYLHLISIFNYLGGVETFYLVDANLYALKLLSAIWCLGLHSHDFAYLYPIWSQIVESQGYFLFIHTRHFHCVTPRGVPWVIIWSFSHWIVNLLNHLVKFNIPSFFIIFCIYKTRR